MDKLKYDFDFKFLCEDDYNKFLNFLFTLAKSESIEDKQMHKKIINSKLEIIALSMADLKAIAKIISKHNPLDFLKYAKDNYYEEVLLQGLVISYIKDIPLQINLFDEWKEKADCWAHCDTVVSNMKLFYKSDEKDSYFEYFYNLCFSEKEFVSRLGIISLMINFLEEKYIDKIYIMCKTVTNKAYYVQMGIAWLISYGFVKFKQKTYILFEEKCLDKFIQNKAICKCRDSFRISEEDKQNLINFRIK